MRTLAATSVAILLAGLLAIPAVAQDLAEVAPAEQEVTAEEVSEEVDMEAPPVAAASDEADQEAEAADEAVEEAVDEATEAQEATEEAVAAEEVVDDADGGLNWTLILGIVAAFIIVWFLLRRRKARRTA